MGKHLRNTSEESILQITEATNQGCMWGMFNHWAVKRVFHHKKKKHSRYKKNTTLQKDQQNVVTESESPLVTQQHRKILNAKDKDSVKNHSTEQKKDGNARVQGSLNREVSIKFKNNDNVLEVISVEKNLLLKYLRDKGIGDKRNHRASRNESRLTKSGSYPLPASSKTKNISLSSLRAKQGEIWDFPKGERLLSGTHAPRPSASDDGIDSVISMQQKTSVSPRPSERLNHKGWNQVVIHQFKVIKQKIKHVIVELKKSGHQTSSIPDDNEKEISLRLDEGAGTIEKYRKSKSLNETKACDSDSNKQDVFLVRRTSSLNESMDKYTQLFEKSLSKEVKWQHSKSKSLKLSNEDKIHKSRHARMFSRSNLSMPNLESLGFILHEVLLDTHDIGNHNTVESDSEFQRKSLEHLTEIDETVERSDKNVNLRSLCDKIVEKIDEDATNDQSEVTTSSISDPLVISDLAVQVPSYEDNTISITEGKESNTQGSNTIVKAELDTNKNLENHFIHFKSYSENNSNIKYVKEVLEFSGFTGNEHNQLRYTVDQPIKPSIFIALEESLLHENECSEEEKINLCDHQLLFDLVNEVLSQIYEKSPTYFPEPFSFNYLLKPMPKGNYLLNEVCDSVNSYLSLRPELDKTLDEVVGRDLMKKSGWMNLQQEEECVALELEEMIMDDLLDEIIFE